MSRLGYFMRPLRGAVGVLAALPDVDEAILVLPTLSRQLDDVKADTARLHEILAELERVSADTSALPSIRADTSVLASIRDELAGISAVALPLQSAAARVGRFADRRDQRRLPREQRRLPPES